MTEAERATMSDHKHYCPRHKTWTHVRKNCPYPSIASCPRCDDNVENTAEQPFGAIKGVDAVVAKNLIRKRGSAGREAAAEYQDLVVEFIRSYNDKNGYAPTYREIAENLDIPQHAVQRYITSLEKRRKVTRSYGKHRGIKVSRP